jgi:hypothetical protein
VVFEVAVDELVDELMRQPVDLTMPSCVGERRRLRLNDLDDAVARVADVPLDEVAGIVGVDPVDGKGGHAVPAQRVSARQTMSIGRT